MACSRRLDSGVRREGVKEQGKRREGEWGIGVNSSALTPCPTLSLFILLTSFCAIHTIWTPTGWALSNVWITAAKILLASPHMSYLLLIIFFQLSRHVPSSTWILVYSTNQHGMSLNMLYHRLRDVETPVLLVVKDQEGFVSELYLYSVIWNRFSC